MVVADVIVNRDPAHILPPRRHRRRDVEGRPAGFDQQARRAKTSCHLAVRGIHATLLTTTEHWHPTMRIEHLRIEGFKSWRAVDFRLAPITGLFGTNSSGKSSLIQFLLMLKQTKEATDRSLALDFGGPSSYAYLGSFRDAVFGHAEELPIRWLIRWRLPQALEDQRPRAAGIDPVRGLRARR